MSIENIAAALQSITVNQEALESHEKNTNADSQSSNVFISPCKTASQNQQTLSVSPVVVVTQQQNQNIHQCSPYNTIPHAATQNMSQLHQYGAGGFSNKAACSATQQLMYNSRSLFSTTTPTQDQQVFNNHLLTQHAASYHHQHFPLCSPPARRSPQVLNIGQKNHEGNALQPFLMQRPREHHSNTATTGMIPQNLSQTPPPTVPFTSYHEDDHSLTEVRMSRKRSLPAPIPSVDSARPYMYYPQRVMPADGSRVSHSSDNVFLETSNDCLISQTLQGRATAATTHVLPQASSMRSVQRSVEYGESQPCEAGEVVVWSSSPSQSPYTDEARAERKSENTTESVRVASSFHVAEIVGKQGAKIKKIRADTNTWIKTPARGEEPVFTISGRQEGVSEAKSIIIASAEKVARLRALRHSRGQAGAGEEDPAINTDGSIVLKVNVPTNTVGLVIGPKGTRIREIAEATNTYIKTPSRYREPVFDLFGLPQDVALAKEQIQAFVDGKKEEENIKKLMGELPIHEPGSPVKPPTQTNAMSALPTAANTNFTRIRPYSPHQYVSPLNNLSSASPTSAHNMYSDMLPHFAPVPMYNTTPTVSQAIGSRYHPTVRSTQGRSCDMYVPQSQRYTSMVQSSYTNTPPQMAQYMPSPDGGQVSPRYRRSPHMQ